MSLAYTELMPLYALVTCITSTHTYAHNDIMWLMLEYRKVYTKTVRRPYRPTRSLIIIHLFNSFCWRKYLKTSTKWEFCRSTAEFSQTYSDVRTSYNVALSSKQLFPDRALFTFRVLCFRHLPTSLCA